MTKNKAEDIVKELLSLAEISVNGNNFYDIQINNDKLYQRILSEQALGLGESYMDGWWDCKALDQFFDRILRAKIDQKVKGNWKIKWHILQSILFNLQKKRRSFQIGERHYDIGNDLYEAMLDNRWNYSCAYWRNAKNIDEAQLAKLELICKKVVLEPGMTVLDLGCGWGSFAKYAAENFNAHVTGVTVSKRQIEIGKKLCDGLPVELNLQDYRSVSGIYDRVISIGFFEHVGPKNYKTYMAVVDRCLKEDGISFLQTIGENEPSTTTNAWTAKYIFPNSAIPSISQISKAMEGIFVIEDLQNLGPHYDKTLMAWHANFEKAWLQLQQKYSDRFYRMWRYYLLSSAGGFRSRSSQLWQIVMTKLGRQQPKRYS